MGIYLKKFSAHTDYEAAKSSLMPPNVSFCVSGPRGVHYKDYCRPSTVYELVGNPSYPSTINGDVASFDINFNYKKTDTDKYCQETVTNSADTVTVNCGENTGSSDRTVSGTVTWNGINIEYSVTQKKCCTVSTVYELVGNPSYPATINGSDETFNISFNYKKTDTDKYCQETVTNSADTVTVECGQNPSTSDARTVSGSVDYHGIEIEYSVTQNKRSNNSTITYYAQSKLLETTDSKADGLHTYSFNPTIKSHSFSNGIGTITFNGDLISIGSYAFQYCTGLTSIVIPDTVKSIGSEAFIGCYNLTSINIPSGATSIGSYAFSGCRSLTSLDIPDSVTGISSDAFEHCSGLTSCTIGSGVTSIGSYAFAYCTGLSSITCNATTAPTIQNNTFQYIKNNGTLYVPIGSTGYNTWMGTGDYYLGKYNWTKVEQ